MAGRASLDEDVRWPTGLFLIFLWRLQARKIVVRVKHGFRYLLRLINANAHDCPILLSAHGHSFRILAADGNPVQSMTATHVVLFPGTFYIKRCFSSSHIPSFLSLEIGHKVGFNLIKFILQKFNKLFIFSIILYKSIIQLSIIYHVNGETIWIQVCKWDIYKWYKVVTQGWKTWKRTQRATKLNHEFDLFNLRHYFDVIDCKKKR